MKKEFIDLARYRLNKAKDTLSDSKKYIESATLASTVNRIYYSMFYAVNGLLITRGLSSSKHSGVLSIFNREIVNKGHLEKKWGEFYSDMFKRRQKGDYQDFVEFEKQDVEAWLKKSEEFIDKIDKLAFKNVEE
ncbi:MAG: HEPN domain-containing protein [Actinobacteria bacterium]|nr:HEPN domain-containing protein [Actinomycetota bacterium]